MMLRQQLFNITWRKSNDDFENNDDNNNTRTDNSNSNNVISRNTSNINSDEIYVLRLLWGLNNV